MPDLFISYAHVDKHWVDIFVPLLEQRVNQYAGRAKPNRIWKDNRLGGNTPLNPEIDTQLAQTECLVACLSSGYLASAWCRYELATFSARTGVHSGRIFCLELDRISPEYKPAVLAEALGYRFWWQDANSKRTYPLTTSHADFDIRLIDLAKDITGVLNPPSIPLFQRGKPILATPNSSRNHLLLLP